MDSKTIFVEAYWEKRNMDKNVLEISYGQDERNCYLDKMQKYDYIVAKVPVNNISLVNELESNGFRYIETQIEILKRINSETLLPSNIRKFVSKISIKRIAENIEFENLLNNLNEQVFDTDRISVDPLLDISVSIKRNKNWVYDMRRDGKHQIYNIIYNKMIIGFSAFKAEGDNLEYVLGGLFKEYKNAGLGLAVGYSSILAGKELNSKHIRTKISSNNLQIVRLYSSLGFDITNMQYVLRKFKSDLDL